LRAGLAVVYSALVALVLLEVFLRLFDPIGIRYYFDTARYFEAMQSDPDYAYLHTPGYEATLQGVDVRINQEGLRGPEFPPTKPPGERRLLILGDSVVFGWGAPQDSIFPAVLQRLIDENDVGPYRVIPAGAGSWNTRTEYEFLRKRAIAYGPDMVVLLVVPNDVEPKNLGRQGGVPSGGAPPLSQRLLRGLAHYSYVAATVQHIVKRRGASQQLVELYAPDSAAWQDASEALGGIARECRERDADLVVFLYTDLASEFARTFYDAYAGALRKLGVPFYTMPAEVFAPSLRNSIVDGHPNAAGHRLIAREMFRVLRDRLQTGY